MNKEVKLQIVYALNLLILAIIGSFIIVYIELKTSHHSDYFEYTALTSTKEVYSLGEDLMMISAITRDKPLYMLYSDILRCQYPGEDWTWFSSTLTYSKKLDKLGSFESNWRYEGDLPRTPALCFLDSYPTVILDYGIKKTQNIKSNTFLIIE